MNAYLPEHSARAEELRTATREKTIANRLAHREQEASAVQLTFDMMGNKRQEPEKQMATQENAQRDELVLRRTSDGSEAIVLSDEDRNVDASSSLSVEPTVVGTKTDSFITDNSVSSNGSTISLPAHMRPQYTLRQAFSIVVQFFVSMHLDEDFVESVLDDANENYFKPALHKVTSVIESHLKGYVHR